MVAFTKYAKNSSSKYHLEIPMLLHIYNHVIMHQGSLIFVRTEKIVL